MHISWYGLSACKLVAKSATIFTDPYSKTSGLMPPRGAGDIVVLSRADDELYSNAESISGEPFIVSGPGEYDIKEVFIHGVPVTNPEAGGKSPASAETIRRSAAYTIATEGLTVGFLGALGQENLTDQQIEELNDVDILLLPVGSGGALDAESAVALVNKIEPSVVIPIHYKTPGCAIKLEGLDRFLKEMGGKGEEMEKLVIKKTDLSEDKTRLILLTPSRG